MHGGIQLTLGSVRQRYWIPRGRQLVKAIIQRCVIYARWRAATQQQIMGDLPRFRVTPERPFLQTGVDYAGPIQLRTTKGRGHRSYKAFVAVFMCLSTKAVHLEIVSDYSADAFLVEKIHSTARALRAFFGVSNPEQRQIADQLANDCIQWSFNPPLAPHFGPWEAAVKSLKLHLRRVLEKSTLTYEEMSTLLTQIEATALNALPEPFLLDAPISRLSRWQLLQRMRDYFWDRWLREYLYSLFQRPKWWVSNNEIRIGRLCLIRSDNTPSTRWLLARIIATQPGEDGQVCVVTVRTATSELTRPIVKIILLPESRCDEEEDEPAHRGSIASRS
ncbi:hypothetical protein ACFW04_002511 [Cataglyphis niger]